MIPCIVDQFSRDETGSGSGRGRALVLRAAIALMVGWACGTGCGSGDPRGGIAVDPDDPLAAGERLYVAACAPCHRMDGTGLAGAGPSLARSDRVQGSEENLARIVLHGLSGPLEVQGVTFNSQMPGMGFLDDAQVAAILSYVRSAWGNRAEPVDPGTVARVRAAGFGRSEPWTVAELARSSGGLRADTYEDANMADASGAREGLVESGSGASGSRSGTVSLDISGYRLAAGPISMKKIKGNASGLTFNPDTGTLFVVVNDPAKIVEVNRDGKALRSVDLVGFKDTEGIAHVGAGRFVVAEEERRTLCLFELDATTRVVRYADSRRLQIGAPARENSGLEGVAYDPISQRLLTVKEKDPRRLLIVTGWTEATLAMNEWDIMNGIDVTDCSGLYFDPATGHLLILSDESRAVVQVDRDGRVMGRLPLGKKDHGLKAKIPKAEGVAMDDRRDLWICSEPDLLYRYSTSH